MHVFDTQGSVKAVRYTPGLLGSNSVLPRPHGLKRLYLGLFGVPDVRGHLTACYLLPTLAQLSFATVLDIGCGNGMLTCLMASQHPQSTILGIDRDEAGLDFASKLAVQGTLQNVRFQYRDIERDGISGQYDLIICLAVLQFIRDNQVLLNKLHSVLSPGGHIVLQLPVAPATQFIMRLPAAHRRLPEFGEARGGFTEAEVHAFLVESGFEVLQLQQIIKGPTILAKELFYLCMSVHPRVAFALCPVLNWLTVLDARYFGPGNGLFVVARKAHEV